MTGTYAGQFAMEGFLNLHWVRWKRVLLTRSIAIVPTFCLAFFSTIQNLTSFNDILNVVMSVQLPFALIPTIAFTSNVEIMGEFVNGIGNILMAILTSLGIVGLNTYFVLATIAGLDMTWYYWLLFAVVAVVYTLFCIYLTVHMVIFMGAKRLMNYPIINKYVWGPSIDAQGMPWTLLRS
ncbi:protein Malvolio-like [Photinus pyralis]|nr:protein Malvolio-like [Photinus pyralis]